MSTIKVDGIRSNSATSDAITLASDGTCTANITNNLSNRNLIINGAMNVAQRGTSSTSSGYATLDRFRLAVANTDQAAYTQKQVSDSPDDFSQSYEFDVTTAETSLDSNEYAFIGHRIEAQNLQSVKANQVTLSFYVKAYQTGTYAINIYQQDGNIHITKTYTISQSGTWEKKTLTFAANTGTQPNNDNGFGWEIAWIMAAGSGVKSSDSTSWGTYSDAGFAFGQGVNVLSSTNNYFKITGVQLEVGSVATDFEHRSYGQELALCQRYYQLIVPRDSNENPIGIFYTNASVMFCLVALKTTMRATPTLDISNYTNAFRAYGSSGVNHSTVSLNTGCTDTIMLQANGDSGTAGYLRLFAQDGGQRAKIAVNAEL